MNKLAKLALLCAMLTPLAGCAGITAGTVELTQLCGGAWREIRVGKDDVLTKETARDILANNVAREAIGCSRGGIN